METTQSTFNNVNKKTLLDNLEGFIIQKRLRITNERRLVLKCVCDQDIEFTVQDVFIDLLDCGISMQTIYNCFRIYLEANLIEQVPTFGIERMYKIKEIHK